MKSRGLYLKISGRVQGVGFRYHARRKALGLGLSGWVRNLPDGSVEAYCEGGEENLKQFLAWAAKGPPGAFVRDLEKRFTQASGLYPGFTIEY